MHRFCVCAGQTVSLLIEQERSRAGVGVRGAEVRPHHSVQLYFRAFCLFTLDAASIRPAAFCYLFSLWVRAPIQSTLSAVAVLQRTHTYTHTLFGPYIAYWDACVPLVACKASSCSTYTHSFPLPTPISSPLNGPWGPELSLRLSRTFSSSCLPVWIPLIYLWISPSLACSRIDHPIFARRLLSLYLKLVSPGEGRKRKEAVLTRVQKPETSPFEFHYKQARAFQKEVDQRGKWKYKGAQRLVI